MKTLPLQALLLINHKSYACISCNKKIQEGIYASLFLPNLLTIASAFIALSILVVLLIWTARKQQSDTRNPTPLNPIPLTLSATVLGIGLGGFFDGIVFHQILQWHEMLSAKLLPLNYVNKSVNMFWDGIFHAFCFIIVFTGIVLLWQTLQRKDINPSGKLLGAGLLAGWGIFNIVEGVINHQLLILHNVHEYSLNKTVWNYGFLLISALMLLMSWILFRNSIKARK